MAVVLFGCQCWSPKGGRREKGVTGTLLFEVLCRLCFSRSSLGPSDDLSSCLFEGQYTPRGPDTRTNDKNTDSRGHSNTLEIGRRPIIGGVSRDITS